MRIFMIILLGTIILHTNLVFGGELLSSPTSFVTANTEASSSFSNQEEIRKIIEISKRLTSPSHRNTFATKLTRYYLDAESAGESPDLLELIRTTARELWLNDIHTQPVIKLKVIGKYLLSLKYPLDAILAYELALQKALSTPIKEDLQRILAQIKRLAQ